MKKFLIKKEKGFALLYTVVIVTLILTIAISISNTSYKQGILSNLAKDSQIAFYQADSGAECALYYDIVIKSFVVGVPAPDIVACGAYDMQIDNNESSDGYYYYTQVIDERLPCFSFLVDKITNPPDTIVESRGHNTCTVGPRQVERAVRVDY